ncbi:hypothetical protein X946_5240 [Burkholderia sp. ABCPW 111]|nr:hypothetical protein X946_5240 [Burkholderia sp. ABCPW 111]
MSDTSDSYESSLRGLAQHGRVIRLTRESVLALFEFGGRSLFDRRIYNLKGLQS